MDDNRKHQDTDFSEDDMRLLYALGEARLAVGRRNAVGMGGVRGKAPHGYPPTAQPQGRNMGTGGGCRRGDSRARDALAAA